MQNNVTELLKHVTLSEEAQQGKYCQSSLKENHGKDYEEVFLLSLVFASNKMNVSYFLLSLRKE